MREGTLELSGLIQGHRRARGLTQEELADRAGIGVRTLSDLERGVHTTARRSTVRRLAAALALDGAALARFEAVAAGGTRPPDPTLPPLFDPFPAGPFVGRRPELAVLRRAWDGAASRGRVVTLVGEPGIGKTRLAAELGHQVATDGALVLAGRCDEHVVLPYGPLAECFSHLVRGAAPEPVSRSAGARQLAGLLPELVVGAPTSAPRRAEGRPDLPVAVSTALGDVAATARLLLVIDDLHWADRPTVLVLRHLARSAPPGLLVVATYQDAEVPPGSLLGGTLADLRRAGVVDRVPLGGLGLDDVAELLARCDRGARNPGWPGRSSSAPAATPSSWARSSATSPRRTPIRTPCPSSSGRCWPPGSGAFPIRSAGSSASPRCSVPSSTWRRCSRWPTCPRPS